jgi:YegS/Rv2252/BmrU family lipid kinase
MLQTYVIINPMAANGKSLAKWNKYKALLTETIGDYDYVITTQSKEATALTQKALESGYEWIIVFGGDGTVNEVINGFFIQGRPINNHASFSVIMTGTGCDFRRSSGSSKNIAKAIKEIQSHKAQKMDVMKLTDGRGDVIYSNNITSLGLGAQTAMTVNSSRLIRMIKKVSGSLAFFIAAFRSLLNFRNKKVLISVNDEIDRVVIKELVLANGSYYGGGMKIAPRASLFSGKMEVVILRNMNLFEFILNNRKFYKGTHIKLKKVENFSTKSLTIESSESISIQVDGELWGKLPLTVELLPAMINFKG